MRLFATTVTKPQISNANVPTNVPSADPKKAHSSENAPDEVRRVRGYLLLPVVGTENPSRISRFKRRREFAAWAQGIRLIMAATVCTNCFPMYVARPVLF